MKHLLLTGGSALALALAAGTAEGATVAFTTPGYTAWTAPATGLYQVDVWGAQGGGTYIGYSYGSLGGLGAGVGVKVELTAGESVYLSIGAQGGNGFFAGGGGGGASAALFGSDTLTAGVIAGAGGGAGVGGFGINGQAPAPLGPGTGGGGGNGGYGGYGGNPGTYGCCGAPGGGLTSYGGPQAGKGFLDGGAGGSGAVPGGFGFAGGGAGSAVNTGPGGGGGGFSGGGGGGSYGVLGAGGGGGGSYVLGGFDTQTLAFKSGNGEVSITSLVPEPPAWGLMITGFGFLGYRLRRHLTRSARTA